MTYSSGSLIDIEDIGEDKTAFRCLTNYSYCCGQSDSVFSNETRGLWLFPNGTAVKGRSVSQYIFSRTREHKAVILHRGRNATSPTGIFTCKIPDEHNVDQKIYFGIYNATEGMLKYVQKIVEVYLIT